MQHFKQQKQHQKGHTWHMQQRNRFISSQCDYILTQNKRLFTKFQIKDPQGFMSDHFLLKATINPESIHSNCCYLKGQQPFPLKHNIQTSQPDTTFSILKQNKEKPTRLNRARLSWITDTTWKLIDKRSSLRKNNNINQLPIDAFLKPSKAL